MQFRYDINLIGGEKDTELPELILKEIQSDPRLPELSRQVKHQIPDISGQPG